MAELLWRPFLTDISDLEPKSAEAAMTSLDRSDPCMKYCLWRRACIITALGPMLLSVALDIFAMTKYLGIVDRPGVFVLSRLDGFVLLGLTVGVGVAYLTGQLPALCSSNEATLSRIAWTTSVALPLVPLLLPITDNSALSHRLQIWQAIPVLLSIAYSLLRSSVRLSLFCHPFFSVSKQVVSFSIPLFDIFVGMSLSQLNANFQSKAIMTVGMCLMVLAPWVFFVKKESFFSARDRGEMKKEAVTRCSIFNQAVIVGSTFVFGWALKVRSLPVNELFQVLFETFGRILINNTLFSDWIVNYSVEEWAKTISSDDRDKCMLSFREIFTTDGDSASTKDKDLRSTRRDADVDTTREDEVELGEHEVFREDLETEVPLATDVLSGKDDLKGKEDSGLFMHDVFTCDLDSCVDESYSE